MLRTLARESIALRALASGRGTSCAQSGTTSLRSVGEMKTKRGLGWLVGGVVLVLIGGLWTLQGTGVIGGSAMSGSMLWAVVGPIVLIVGIVLLVRWGRRR